SKSPGIRQATSPGDGKPSGGGRPPQTETFLQSGSFAVRPIATKRSMPRPVRAIEQIVRDSVLAFRTFGRFPLFTAAAVITIGFGMGFNTTLFSVMHAVLFRPLPVAEPETLRSVFIDVSGGRGRSTYSAPGGM